MKKVTPLKKAKISQQVERVVAETFDVTFDDIDEVDFEVDSDNSDDELEQDAVEFEFQGEMHWKTWDGFILDEEDGPQVGRWDDASNSIVYFD